MLAAGEVDAQLELLRAGVTSVTSLDPGQIDVAAATAAHRELSTLCDQIKVFAARLLARVESDGRWAAGGGARTFPEWVARGRRSSVAAARQEANLGRALEDALPGTSRAAASGEITLGHAEALARIAPTSVARRAALASAKPDRNEEFLLQRARSMGVDDYRREVRRWAARVDQSAQEREHESACAKEYLHLTRRPDGMSLAGFLTTEHGYLLATALGAVGGVPAADDERAPELRRAAALTSLAKLVLDKGLAGGGSQVRPHISVHVSWESMQRLARAHPAPEGAVADPAVADPAVADPAGADPAGADPDELVDPAELDDGEPIPGSVLARIACDSEISRIVFGPSGQVLDVGRAQRTYGGSLRRAVIARDRSCQYPDCGAPPNLGEVHHVVPWSAGGDTSVANGILLCWYHHDLLHRRRLRVIRSQVGQWCFYRTDGTRVVAPPGGMGSRAVSDSPPGGMGSRAVSDSPPGGVGPGGGGSPGGDRVRDDEHWARQDMLPLAV